MIRMVLLGRTGNQLFQYALGRHLSIKHREILVLDASRYGDKDRASMTSSLRRLKLAGVIVGPRVSILLSKVLRGRILGTYYEREQQIDLSVLVMPRVRTYVGYFQSEKYFAEIADIIRTDLQLAHLPLSAESNKLLTAIEGAESVSVHVRRADYLRAPHWQVCTPDYYKTAMERMRQELKRPRFYFFSDDIQWCAANFRSPDFVFCDLEESTSEPLNDLRLMSACKHHIIANSSFSWWGAWLNSSSEKKVFCPYIWFNKPKLCPSDDIAPTQWTKIVF